MFLPFAYDYVMWSCSITLILAGIIGPELFVTPIFGIKPTVYVEITMYSAGVLTSHPVIAWNIYKYFSLFFFSEKPNKFSLINCNYLQIIP